MNRRKFIQLACAVILGSKIGLPLGQIQKDITSSFNREILDDIEQMIEMLSANFCPGPYTLIVP